MAGFQAEFKEILGPDGLAGPPGPNRRRHENDRIGEDGGSLQKRTSNATEMECVWVRPNLARSEEVLKVQSASKLEGSVCIK
jgi:hypothetical protein